MEIFLRIVMNVMTGMFAWLFYVSSGWAIQGWFDKDVQQCGAGILGMLIMGVMILVCALDMRDLDNKKFDL